MDSLSRQHESEPRIFAERGKAGTSLGTHVGDEDLDIHGAAPTERLPDLFKMKSVVNDGQPSFSSGS